MKLLKFQHLKFAIVIVCVHILFCSMCVFALSSNVFYFLRHSRFGGSYIVQGLKSIGDKDVIYHRNLNNVSK